GLRLLPLQVLLPRATAGEVASFPDRDGVIRGHYNPRLLAIARGIPRGNLLDRTGKPLATGNGEQRRYPLGGMAAHITGYLDPRFGGPTGAEKTFDPLLRGFPNYASLAHLWLLKDLPVPLPRP